MTIAAMIYAAATTLPIAMHVGLIAGAPWGRFTMGGHFSGRLPAVWRVLPLVQAALLIAMSCSVLQRANLLDLSLPSYAFPLTLLLTFVTLIANSFSPSRPERRLWTPVTAAMALSAAAVAFP
jgi:hypothetical protein